MPIVVKDYTWHQTENFVIIHVPLRGVHQSKVDIFTTAKLIKASYEQFHFEVFLRYPIEVRTSKCTVTDKNIVFELVKSTIAKWECLEDDLSREEKSLLRKELIEKEFARQRAEEEQRLVKKDELKRLAVGESIKVDAIQREKIENLKLDEKKFALGDYNKWHSHFNESRLTITELESSDDEDEIEEPEEIRQFEEKLAPQLNQKLPKVVSSPATIIPPIRQTQSLQVAFTERILPTPSRESKLAEENEYLEKQAMARRSAGFASEDLRPEEKNPQYLLAKGDEFLKNQNYLGAISAYSFGIKISDKFVDFYIQRAQAHVAIENYRKALDDCSTAIELMKPEVEANRHYRAVCIATRAFALNKIGMKRQAIEEMSFALRLEPKNEMFLRRMHGLEADEMNDTSSDDTE